MKSARHATHLCLRPTLIGLSLLLCTAPALQAASPVQEGAPTQAASPYQQIKPTRDGIGKAYMGREIAGVMGWQAAAWLEREDRAREENSDALMAGLHLKPGMTVADIGAGTGYYTRRFAEAVGRKGKVYAVDLQPEMLELLRQLAQKAGLKNIEAVQGAEDQVPLPAESVDLAIMIDVYHELSYPAETLASIVRTLKPDGRVVFVEYRAEDDEVPIKPLHKMSVAQVEREAAAQSLVLDRSVPGLPWQHVLVFKRR